jgi:uncharacterized protein YuzE
MKIQYVIDTDTLLMRLREAFVAETRGVDADTRLDLDRHGQICAITVEHASQHSGALRSPTTGTRARS